MVHCGIRGPLTPHEHVPADGRSRRRPSGGSDSAGSAAAGRHVARRRRRYGRAAGGAAVLGLAAAEPARGALADRLPARRLLGAALLAAGLGCTAGAALALVAAPAVLLALAGFAAATGALVAGLVGLASVPLLAPAHVVKGNARLELARAAATLAAPALAGVLAGLHPAGPFVLAAAAALAGARLAAGIATPAPGGARRSLRAAMGDGIATVRADASLRAIAICAFGWNVGFLALTAAFAPLALGMGLSQAMIGLAQAGYGAGLVLGALAAPALVARLPGLVLPLFGPASSGLGALLMAAAPSAASFAVGWFLLGFGPMLWLIWRNTVMQARTAAHQRASVAALMQVAVYGVRPLGALAAGALGAAAGPHAALWLAVVCFAAATGAILPLLRPPAACTA
jgi:hypothetical protein